MKMPPSMGYSIAVSVLILAGGSAIAWRDHLRLVKERASLAQVIAQTQNQGPREATARMADQTKHMREARPAVPDVDIADVVAVAQESEACRKAGKMKDEVARKRDSDLFNQIRALNKAQLIRFIAGLQSAKDLTEDQKRWYFASSLNCFANQDAEGALAILADCPSLLGNSEVIAQTVSILLGKRAAQDPLAAVEWLRKLQADHPEIETRLARRDIIVKTAAKYPDLALKLLHDLDYPKDPVSRGQIIGMIAEAPQSDDARLATLAAMREYVRTEGDTDELKSLKAVTISRIASAVAKNGFDSSAKWLSRANLDDAELWRFVTSVGEYDSTKGDTGRWLNLIAEKFPYGSLSERKIVEKDWRQMVWRSANDWGLHDSPAVGKWLATLPPGELHEECTCGFAWSLAEDYPDTAAQWFKTLKDQEHGREMLRKVYTKLLAAHPDAAAVFAERHGLK